MAALESSQILAARNLGASRPRILFDIMLPQVLPTIGVALVLSTVTMMSVLSVPLMIGVGTPTMLTVDMAFRVNSYGDYAVANALGVVSLAICGALSWFYLRHSLQQKAVNHESAGPRINPSAWWVKGRRKMRASPVLQTLLLLFMLLAMFGPLLNLLIWTVAESWYFPIRCPVGGG